MQNNLNVDEMVNQFINQLVVDANMEEGLEVEVFSELKKDLKKRLESRINAVILSHIPESKLPEFEGLIDKGDVQATQNFITSQIPNLTEVLASEFLSFRTRYIS